MQRHEQNKKSPYNNFWKRKQDCLRKFTVMKQVLSTTYSLSCLLTSSKGAIGSFCWWQGLHINLHYAKLTHTSLAWFDPIISLGSVKNKQELECINPILRYDITLKHWIQHLHLKIETSKKHQHNWNQITSMTCSFQPTSQKFISKQICPFSFSAPSMPPCLSKLSKQRVKRYNWFAGKCLGRNNFSGEDLEFIVGKMLVPLRMVP